VSGVCVWCVCLSVFVSLSQCFSLYPCVFLYLSVDVSLFLGVCVSLSACASVSICVCLSVDFNGKKMLRYLSADPGSAIACITCHNRWEGKPEIKKLREKQGVEKGKIFQMHELMGALSINVALTNK